MAFGRRAWYRGQTDKTLGNGFILGSLGSGTDYPQVGDLVLFGVAHDNLSASTPTITNMYVSGGTTGAVTFAGTWTTPAAVATAAGSVLASFAWGRVTTAFDGTTQVTIIFSGNITAKVGAVTAYVDAADPVFDRGTSMQYNSFSDWGNAVPHVAGDKIAIILASEDNATFTLSDTSGDLVHQAATTGGGAAANVAYAWQDLTFIGTGALSYYPTSTTQDGGRLGVVIKPAATTTPVSASRSTSWAVNESVSASRSTSWAVLENLLSVTASRSTSWATLAAVTASRATTWRVLAQAIASRVTSWVTRAQVTPATRSTSWRVLAPISAVRSTSWRVLQSLSAARSTSWNVIGPVVATRVTSWTVKAITTAQRATSWNTLKAVEGGGGAPTVNDYTSPVGFTWTTYTPPPGTTSILIECFGMAQGTWPEQGGYAKGTLAYTGQVLRYQIPLTGGGDNTGYSNIVQADGTDLIRAGNGWDDGVIDGAHGVGWVDTARLTNTLTETGTQSSLTPHIKFTASSGGASLSRSTTWAVRALATAQRATSWATRAIATAQRATSWNTRAVATAQRGTTWATRATVTAQRSTTWTTKSTTNAARSTSWAVRTPVTASRSTTWAVEAPIMTMRGVKVESAGTWYTVPVKAFSPSANMWVQVPAKVHNGTAWV